MSGQSRPREARRGTTGRSCHGGSRSKGWTERNVEGLAQAGTAPRARLTLERCVDVLHVIVLVDLGEERLDLAARGGVLQLHRRLGPPADADRRERPAAGMQRLADRVEIGRLGVEAESALAIGLEVLC